MKFPIGVIASTLSPDLRAAAPRARQIGFDGLQLDVAAGGVDLTQLSQSGRREVRHLLSSHNQQLLSLRTDTGIKGLSPSADIDRAIARIDQAMDAAAGLGASILCIDLGPLPEPASAPKPRKKIDPAAAGLIIIPSMSAPAEEPAAPVLPADAPFESSVDGALVEIGHRADRYSLMIALRADLASLAALERALLAARCPWFGVDLDTVALLRDSWDADEAFSRLGALVRHVRARDANKGHDRRTRPAIIGAGDIDWPATLARLDEAAYRGPLVIDPTELPDRPAAAARALEVLRNV